VSVLAALKASDALEKLDTSQRRIGKCKAAGTGMPARAIFVNCIVKHSTAYIFSLVSASLYDPPLEFVVVMLPNECL
jgi:hypothetical protein